MADEHHKRLFKDRELIYAATSRCPCGAGLAYSSKDEDPTLPYKGPSAWDCADVLTGRAIKSGQPGAVAHGLYPFALYEVKSENQPSAQGATTRPS